MSLKDVVEGVEQQVGALFGREPADIGALRGTVLDAIATAERQWSARDGDAQPAWFSAAGDHVAFSPHMPNGAPLTIDGQTTVFVPADRFADYLAAMRAQVEAGAFDAELNAAHHGSANVSGLATVSLPPRGEGGSGGVVQGE